MPVFGRMGWLKHPKKRHEIKSRVAKKIMKP